MGVSNRYLINEPNKDMMRHFIIVSQNHDNTVLFLKTIVSVMWSVSVKLTLDYDAGQICTLIIMGTFCLFAFFPVG